MYLRMLSETLIGATIVQSDNDQSHEEEVRKLYRYEGVRGCKERIKPCKTHGRSDENGPAVIIGDDEYENKDNR